MNKGRIAAVVTTTALALAGVLAGSAAGSYHQMMITEVHEGPGAPTQQTGDFIELQMWASGQNFVSGRYIQTLDGGGTAFSTYLIPGNAANGGNQRTILFANDASTVGADYVTGDLNVINANGGACFTDTVLSTGIDCVTWGGFGGTTPSPSGTPASVPADTIPPNGSLIRNSSRGCATALDPADDTNNSAADFALGTPSPRSNATAPTEQPCKSPAKKKCKKKKKAKKGEAAAAKKKCKKKKKKK